MLYQEYGSENEKVIILLHGGGLSRWSYESVAEKISDRYHVVLPVLDGHGESTRSFVSIEDNAENIIRFIDEKFSGHIYMLGGLSLGGQVALEILSKRKDICQFAVIESAMVIPSKITELLIKPMINCSYWLVNKPHFARLQFDYLKINPVLYEKYYESSIKITKDNMISFLTSNCSYRIKPSLKDTQVKVLVLAGSKEQKSIIKSAKSINEIICDSDMEIVNGLYHGQLSMNYPDKYVCYINKLLKL